MQINQCCILNYKFSFKNIIKKLTIFLKTKGFTGIDSPYEPPKNPDIVLDTCNNTVAQCAQTIVNYLKEKVRLHDNLNKTKL